MPNEDREIGKSDFRLRNMVFDCVGSATVLDIISNWELPAKFSRIQKVNPILPQNDSLLQQVTYTSVYTDSEPGRVFWGTDEEVYEGCVPRVIYTGYDGFPISSRGSKYPVCGTAYNLLIQPATDVTCDTLLSQIQRVLEERMKDREKDDAERGKRRGGGEAHSLGRLTAIMGYVSTVDMEARQQGIREVGYGIRDTWIDLAETIPAIVPTTCRIFMPFLRSAQDGRSRISAASRIRMQARLFRLRLQLQSTLIRNSTQVLDPFSDAADAMAKLRLRVTDLWSQAAYSRPILLSAEMRHEMGEHVDRVCFPARAGEESEDMPGTGCYTLDHQEATGDSEGHT
ncbi:hypothetical protein Tco_1143136 [Tanacetum coccineum]